MEDYTKLPEVPKLEKTVRDVVHAADEKVKYYKRNKKLLIPIAATIAEIIALLAIIGLLTLIKADFVLKDVTLVGFLVVATLRVASVFLGKDVAARMRVSAAEKEPEHAELQANYKAEIDDVDAVALDEYLRTVANPERKKAAWKAQWQHKIERTAAALARLDVILTIQQKNDAPERKVAKTKRKISALQTRLEKYNAFASDEYYNANEKILHVNYEHLTVEMFFNSTDDGDNPAERVRVKKEFEIKKYILKGMPFVLLVCSYVALVSFENVVYGEINPLTLALDVLLLAFYLGQGWYLVGGHVVDLMRDALIYKTTFIKKFKALKDKDKSSKVG